MKGQKLKYVLALLCVGGSSLMMLLPQQVIRFTVDAVIAGDDFSMPGFLERIYFALGGRHTFLSNLWLCGLLVLLIYLINSVFSFFRMWLNSSASQSATKKLKDRLYDHLNHMPYAAHVAANTGDLLQRCSSDVETVRRFMSTQIVEIVRTVFMFTFAMMIMLSMNKTMTFVTIIVVIPLLGFSVWFYKIIRRTFIKVEEAEGRLSTVMQENFTAVRVVRAFGQQKQEMEKFDTANGEFREHSMQMNNHLSVFWSFTDFLIYGQVVITTVVGCILAFQGQISVGMLMSFSSYATTLLWPVRQLGRVLSHLGRTSVALGRIKEVLDAPIEEDPPDALTPTIRGDVVFDHVSLSYEDGREVLTDISFHAGVGETIGILGTTGSGKSSMVQLLQRLYEPDGGAIYLDGVNIKDIQLKWLRQHVGIVLQEPFLYSRTIMDNIRITDPSLSHDEVMRAARIAQIDSLAREFDEGFDTMVGERGVTLSGGQQQRVAIARMLLQDSPIMIFDDSLSALDTETDAAIRKALKENKRDRTTFIISHRVTTLFEADRILVLEDGRITQAGTHEELLALPGLYRNVWDIYGRMEIEALTKGGDGA
ncbi:ABC transporter ATP-binding protein/permease [Eubacteriales bacterium OttesenSCG-928-M02]|nr:ABC transporter ATP-binding protein/permease [Eubacteriales bacterium OttesenSCG-928-M02]